MSQQKMASKHFPKVRNCNRPAEHHEEKKRTGRPMPTVIKRYALVLTYRIQQSEPEGKRPRARVFILRQTVYDLYEQPS